MNARPPALQATQLVHRYGTHTALDGLDLRIEPGEVFALLGPNGSGKTTLFKLISTLSPVTEGALSIFGYPLPSQAADVRRQLGVVFQNPSCDRKLTVLENLRCQATLFGLSRSVRDARIDQVANELGFKDRLDWNVEKLSGGMQRRVDIAKSMLHAPRLLVLDEPSTGLDPAARLDLWHALMNLARKHGVTLLLTTHLLEEAEKAERIGILHRGKLVALGNPTQLREELGKRVLVAEVKDKSVVVPWLNHRNIPFELQDGQLRITGAGVEQWVAPLTTDCATAIGNLFLGQPSLEDVFILRTGYRFWDAGESRGTSA